MCLCNFWKQQGMLFSHLSPCLSVSEGDRRMWARGSVSSAPRLWWALFLSLWASMQLCLVLSSLTPDHLASCLYLPRLPLLPKPPPALAISHKPLFLGSIQADTSLRFISQKAAVLNGALLCLRYSINAHLRVCTNYFFSFFFISYAGREMKISEQISSALECLNSIKDWISIKQSCVWKFNTFHRMTLNELLDTTGSWNEVIRNYRLSK